MIILAILGSLAAIGVLCWLLFKLAVFALPAFAGVTIGVWAHQTGAGALGAIAIGVVAAGAILGIGQLLLAFVRPMWLKLLVALAFVAPAAIAGYHATHGIVKHTMPSEIWQLVFSVIGAVAVGITAFVRITTMASPGPSGQDIGGGSVAIAAAGADQSSPKPLRSRRCACRSSDGVRLTAFEAWKFVPSTRSQPRPPTRRSLKAAG